MHAKKQAKNRFWMVTPEELKEAYAARKITADFYIAGIIKCQAPGFVIKTTIKEFCKEWGIERRTFNKALHRLAENGVHFEVDSSAPIKFWHGGEVVKLPPKTPENSSSNTENSDSSCVNKVTPISRYTENSSSKYRNSSSKYENSSSYSSDEKLDIASSCDAIYKKDKKRYLSEREENFFAEEKELASGNSESNQNEQQLADSVSTLAKKMSVPSTRKSTPEEQTSPVCLNLSKDETIVNSPNFCRWLESYKKAEGHRIKNGKAYVAVCLRNRGEGREDILDLYRKWQRLTVNLDGEQTEYLGYEVPDFTAPERGHDWHKKINDEWERLAQREVDFGSELDFAVAKASEEMSNKYRWFGHWVNFASKNYPSLKINPQPRNLNDTDASLNAREKIRAQIEAARKKNKAQRAANREKMARGE